MKKVAQIFCNLVKAIGEIEARGILLWNLSPENILVHEDSR